MKKIISQISINYFIIGSSFILGVLVGLEAIPPGRDAQIAAGFSVLILAASSIWVWIIAKGIENLKDEIVKDILFSQLRNQRRILILLVLGGIISTFRFAISLQNAGTIIDNALHLTVMGIWIGACITMARDIFQWHSTRSDIHL